MKKIILMVLVFAAGTIFAQQQQTDKQPKLSQKERKEKIEAYKVGFISQKLALTTDEAKKFWPVYDEFGQKRDDLRKKMLGDRKGKKMNIDSLSDKEAEARVDNEIAFHEQMVSLEKEYNSKFKAVLPVKKVAKLYQAEKEFRFQMGKKMMRKNKNNRMHQHQKPAPQNSNQNQNPQGGGDH